MMRMALGTSAEGTAARTMASSGTAGGAAQVVGTRVALWVGIQLLVAGIAVIGGSAAGHPLNAAAGWWMVYGSLVDIGTLAVLLHLLRREGTSYRELLGPPIRGRWLPLAALGVVVATIPAVVVGVMINTAFYGGETPPMVDIVDLPLPASIFTIAVWPLLAELAEPVAYFGFILPRLERAVGSRWLAAAALVAIWAAEHAFFPILIAGGGVDLGFAAYRVISVLPFLAVWTALYHAIGRRLLPIMIGRWIFNGGTAFAAALGLA